MSIGSGIALLVLGAILTFAVDFQVQGIDISLIGQILMAAGAVVFLIGLAFAFKSRQSRSTTRSAVDPATGEQVTRRSTSTDDPAA